MNISPSYSTLSLVWFILVLCVSLETVDLHFFSLYAKNVPGDGVLTSVLKKSNSMVISKNPSIKCPFLLVTEFTTDVKVHMWKIICLPSLLHNLKISPTNPKKYAKRVHASIIKWIVGFPKRSHHGGLLNAVSVHDVMSLWWRLFRVGCPAWTQQLKLVCFG